MRMIGALFDKDRKGKVRDAVKEDKALPGIKKAEPLPDTLAGANPVHALMGAMILFKTNHRQAVLNLELAWGVQHRDIILILKAIQLGGDVNGAFVYDSFNKTPVNPSSNPPQSNFMYEARTPLRLAIDYGFDDVAELLRANGARE